MQIRLMTTDGSLHTSDSTTIAEARAAFDGPEGQFREALHKVTNMMGSIGSMDSVTLTVNGIERNFNVSHVIWVEVNWEGESLPEIEQTDAEARRDALRRARPAYR